MRERCAELLEPTRFLEYVDSNLLIQFHPRHRKHHMRFRQKTKPDKALTRAASIQAPYTFAWFPAIWQHFITWEAPPSLPAKPALQSLTTKEARKPTGTHPNYQRKRFASVEQGFHLFILIWFDCRPERGASEVGLGRLRGVRGQNPRICITGVNSTFSSHWYLQMEN